MVLSGSTNPLHRPHRGAVHELFIRVYIVFGNAQLFDVKFLLTIDALTLHIFIHLIPYRWLVLAVCPPSSPSF